MLLTPEQFELVCAENRESVLELPADGHLIAMKLSGGGAQLPALEAGCQAGTEVGQVELA